MSDDALRNFLIISGLAAGAVIVAAIYNRQRLKEAYFPAPETIRVPIQRGLPDRRKKK